MDNDPFKVETLIAWLETKPADEEYCYIDDKGCMLAQYFTACGFVDVSLTPESVLFAGGRRSLPKVFNDAAWHASTEDRTFGGALQYLKTKVKRRDQSLFWEQVMAPLRQLPPPKKTAPRPKELV